MATKEKEPHIVVFMKLFSVYLILCRIFCFVSCIRPFFQPFCIMFTSLHALVMCPSARIYDLSPVNLFFIGDGVMTIEPNKLSQFGLSS